MERGEKTRCCDKNCRVADPEVVGTGFYETLDGIIKRDRRWLPSLLDYVCYAPNPAIQAQAVHITLTLNQRLPQLPDLLLQPIAAGAPVQNTFTLPFFYLVIHIQSIRINSLLCTACKSCPWRLLAFPQRDIQGDKSMLEGSPPQVQHLIP